ncbi:hypothetical protein [Actinacidiphila alni]|uniref:hypothetical protein n=1 Tax=Actinacidiphila alni TaxID=380248 RepID=UPI0034529D7E
MTFFQEFPEPPQPEAPPRRREPWEQPDHVLPASVPGDAVVIRTPDAAVWAGAVQAYPNGFALTLRVVRRGPGGAYRDPDPFAPGDAGTGLRFGLEFADGRRAAMGHGMPVRLQQPRDDGPLWLQPNGGGGNHQSWDQNLWIAPLPPDGPVLLVGSWPEAGVDEQRAELDGTAIRAAAVRAVELWPEEEAPDAGRGVSFRVSTAHAADADAD